MRYQAMDINRELDSQSQLLSAIDSKTEHVAGRLQNNTSKVKKLLK
jgi:hypothetical protein